MEEPILSYSLNRKETETWRGWYSAGKVHKYRVHNENRDQTGHGEGRQGKRNGKQTRTDNRIMATQMTRRCGLALTGNRSFSTQS